MYGIALSRFGLSIKDFDDLCPVEFQYALDDANERELSHYRTQYEVARWLARHIWNSRGRVTKRLITKVHEVEEFPWDNLKQSVDQLKHGLMAFVRAFSNLPERPRKIGPLKNRTK